MITIVNKDNSVGYTNLYRLAEEQLNKTPGSINSLDKYFYYLPELERLRGTTEDENYNKWFGRRYAMLPIGEEYFEITANDRRIKIPDNFRLNGIGVQGDQIAETLYFRINRYFDHMDLNNTNIYIQWQYIDEKGKEVDSGTCSDWVRDITSDPNYLIFGWVIKDDITANAGIIRFSVRFVQWDENKENIIYNLGTIEHQLTVNRTLMVEFNLAEIEQNIAETEYLMSTSIKPAHRSDLINVEAPEYLLTLIDYITKNNGEKNENGHYQVDLIEIKDENNNIIKEYVFQIQAKSTDGGYINYEWYDLSNIKNGKPTLLSGAQAKDAYVRVLTDEQIKSGEEIQGDANKIYYKPNNEGTGYIIDTSMNIGASNIIQPYHYFRYGQYKANKAGKYLGVAINQHDNGSSKLPNATDLLEKHNDGSYSVKYSDIYGPVEIPGPEPTIIEMAEKVYFTEDEIVITPTIINTTADTNKEYQWYKVQNQVKEQVGDSQQLRLQATKNNQGQYYLSVKAFRNNASIINTTEASPITITYQPSDIKKITLQDNETQSILGAGANINPGDTIIAGFELNEDYQLPEYSGYKIEWYYVTDNSETLVFSSEDSLQYSIPENDTLGKRIKCKIYNKYNGMDSAPQESVTIFIGE